MDNQRPPNFQAARAAGISIVGIRGAWGYVGKAFEDPTLARDQASARAAGMRLFSYLFLDYNTDVLEQVEAIEAAYKRLPGDLPLALDLEMDRTPAGTTAASRLAMAEQAALHLKNTYGPLGVMVYTSLAQWTDHFDGLDSAVLGSLPLWIKTPYAWNPRNPLHLSGAGTTGELPLPWQRKGSPGAWLQQFQGDCLGLAGFSSTVDISCFLLRQADDPWVEAQTGGLVAWQKAHGLSPDGIAGPEFLATLTATP